MAWSAVFGYQIQAGRGPRWRPPGRAEVASGAGGAPGGVVAKRARTRPEWSTCFVQIAPGLEGLLADELRELGLDAVEAGGGALAACDLAGMYRIHLWSRLAGRVTVEVARGRVSSLAGLAELVGRAPWGAFVHPGQPLEVRADAGPFGRRDLAERKVAHAIGDALGRPRSLGPRAPRVAARVTVRADGGQVALSVDASGELLHRRGWRRDTTTAPLRENLAAALLRAADWSPGEPLVDPMCGSGTFVIEAATRSAGIAPGARRGFAFEAWPSHDEALWDAIGGAGSGGGRSSRAGILLGADRAPEALEASRANARRAGILDRVELVQRRFVELQPPARRGLVIVNPPYGHRLDEGRGDSALRALGARLREAWGGWRVAVLTPERHARRLLGLDLEGRVAFSNGGIRVRLLVGTVPKTVEAVPDGAPDDP